jgi:uncharacterized OB-fold protein
MFKYIRQMIRRILCRHNYVLEILPRIENLRTGRLIVRRCQHCGKVKTSWRSDYGYWL